MSTDTTEDTTEGTTEGTTAGTTAEAPPAYEQGPVFPVLDTLRAVGALAVLTTHVAFWSGDYLGNGVWGTLLSRLDIGVAVFFVLSGFLLSRPYLARARDGLTRPSTGRYAVKRVLRIYPVYAVTAVLALLLIHDNHGTGVGAWARALTLTDIYTSSQLPHGLTHMWSLAVEVSFYVVLPGLMLLATGRSGPLRPRRVVALLAVMTAVSVGWHLSLGSALGGVSGGTPVSWLPAYLTWFAVGIGLALAHVLLETARETGAPVPAPVRFLATLGSMPGACWTLAAGLLLVAATPLAGPSLLFVATPAESLLKHLVYACFGGLLVVTGVFASPGYAGAMSVRAARHLGHISYGLFCIHLPLISAVMAVTHFTLFAGNFVQLWVLTVVVSVAAAEVLYRVVELPAIGLKDRLPRRRTRDDEGSAPSRKPQSAATQS